MQEVRSQQRKTRVADGDPVAIVQAEPTFHPAPTQFQPRPTSRKSVLSDLPQAPHDIVTRQPGSFTRLAINTAGRAALISGGLYFAGIRGFKPLVLGSVLSSATLSFLLTVHHAYVARRGW